LTLQLSSQLLSQFWVWNRLRRFDDQVALSGDYGMSDLPSTMPIGCGGSLDGGTAGKKILQDTLGYDLGPLSTHALIIVRVVSIEIHAVDV
jgi:hypothetical protein